MRIIVIPEDDLRRLERRFGPDVRRMGPWISDGVFGYTSVSLSIVERVAEAVNQPGLPEALSRLQVAQEPAAAFLDLMEAFGPYLIVEIKAAHSAASLAPPSGRSIACAKQVTARTSGAAAAT
jgi:hypothetical protein